MNPFGKIIFAALASASLSAHAGLPIINLSVEGEIKPGVYGQVQIGNLPPPPVFFPQPMIIHSHPSAASLPPLYLHVPPGHAKKWSKHCQKYNACDRPVYFVKSAEYEPGYKAGDRDRRDKGRGDEGRGNEGKKDKGHGEKGNKGKGNKD